MTFAEFKNSIRVQEIIETLKGNGVEVNDKIIEKAHDKFTEYENLQHGEELTDSEGYDLINLCFERALSQ